MGLIWDSFPGVLVISIFMLGILINIVQVAKSANHGSESLIDRVIDVLIAMPD